MRTDALSWVLDGVPQAPCAEYGKASGLLWSPSVRVGKTQPLFESEGEEGEVQLVRSVPRTMQMSAFVSQATVAINRTHHLCSRVPIDQKRCTSYALRISV